MPSQTRKRRCEQDGGIAVAAGEIIILCGRTFLLTSSMHLFYSGIAVEERRTEMKTFAELKRSIKPGVHLFVVEHNYRPELTGTTRVVGKVQTNGYWFHNLHDSEEKRAWSKFAPAKCYSFPTPDTFRHDEGVKCCCGVSSSPGATQHSEYCNMNSGRRFAWTIKILPEIA